MKKNYNVKLNREVVEIFAGDFYAVSKRDIGVVLTTLLGSCISVCLFDNKAGVCGMNHFMLPGKVGSKDMLLAEDARYGFYSMEMLINEMLKLGAYRERLQAKIFGGGKLLNGVMNNVSGTNIEFAKNFLNMEQIPVVAQDVGGDYGRKIYFFSDTFTVYQRKVRYKRTVEKAVRREKNFYDWMKKTTQQDSELTLFDD